MLLIKTLYESSDSRLRFSDVRFRTHSQHEEDGILLFIFSLIGVTNKKCVEICCGDGMECNSANLILNHGWIGLLFDGNESNVEVATRFYATHPDSKHWPPMIIHQWITKENVNQLIRKADFIGEIDLLSLDIDGNDYWVWEAIDCISPRVVVLEFNHLWGAEESVSVPYDSNFVAEFSEYGSDYAGASLKAFVKLGQKKGYKLIATNAIATNAFFLRKDITCSWLPEIQTEDCFNHPRAKFGMHFRLPKVKHKKWTKI